MSKRALVLLPGLLCDAALWRHQSETLTDICAPWVADLTLDEAIPAMAERVLEAAPRTFCLAGLSMGGYVAQDIMRRAPERVERLALIDTNARADTAEQVKTRKELIRLSEIGKFKGVTPRLLPNLIHPSRLKDPTVADVVLQMAERVGQEAFIRQQKAIMGRVDGRGDLNAIRVPTLVLCGRQDALTPVALHTEMAEAIPNARLVVVEDCGHLAPLERPYATSATLRYWLA
ncbi:MAG: alpha/beta fold hydrolase [Rhodospirillaceae bacterium]|nr:alpha/beta fold hydrolase [Rhodospirillaceae bacterium]